MIDETWMAVATWWMYDTKTATLSSSRSSPAVFAIAGTKVSFSTALTVRSTVTA